MSTNDITKCSACGTSPVNHKFLFISSLIEETVGNFTDKFFNFSETKTWHKISISIEKILFIFFTIFHIVTFSDDIEKTLTGRSKLIWEEARRRGIPMQQIKIFGKYVDFYKAKINGKYYYFHSLPIPPWLIQNGYKWLDDKLILFKKLSKENIPVPKTVEVFSLKKALQDFQNFKKPVIIKPKNGSRGRHTTTNINNEQELKQAIKIAQEITLWMVMQEHLFGSVYRATVIDNKLVGFFKADPAYVVGDEIKNIEELIKEKNTKRNEEVSDILINDDLINFIKKQGYDLKSILKENLKINLSAKTGRMYGGYTKEMLPEVHPKIHQIFEKAAKIVEAPVAGFDLIMEDPTKDPDTQHWGIIECNSLPFIDLHYMSLEGTQINLAKNVWDLWSKKI